MNNSQNVYAMAPVKNDIARLLAIREGVRRSFPLYASLMKGPEFLTPFHMRYYHVLNAFAHGRIKKLFVTIPPQHGKSEGSTRLLPSYLFGINPDLRIAIGSYNDTFARKFNRAIQRIIDSDNYRALFPDTYLNGKNNERDSSHWMRNNTEFEIVNHLGFLKAVGRNGALTGERIDIAILDDIYKNAAEGNSPLIRENAWEWYTSTVRTRFHNNSRELMVFTRWHEDDLIGKLLAVEPSVEMRSLDDIDPSFDGWHYLNFEAIKDSAPTDIDPRTIGEALWPEMHDLASLMAARNADRLTFECMYQGHPNTKEGLLYGDFDTYDQLPPDDDLIARNNYTDTADTGEDMLCSICYVVDKSKNIYVTDLVFTDEPMETTETLVADLLQRSNTRRANIESNNGGRGFARAVIRILTERSHKTTRVSWFHQSDNKESRILTNAPTVKNSIRMPANWRKQWPEFYYNVTTYRRLYKANKTHDAADVLTGIVEMEIIGKGGKVLSHN